MKQLNSILEGMRIQQYRQNAIKTINVNELYHKNKILEIARSLVPGFTLTTENKKILLLLFLYFTGSRKFPHMMLNIKGTEGSLNKGLMLVGGVGSGKTKLFEIFKKYTRDIIGVNSFQCSATIDIINEVNVSGAISLEKFSHNIYAGEPHPIVWYIDDIASKNESIKHYGTNINVIEDILYFRYNVFSKYRILTHTSTNIYPIQMLDFYDKRIVDRIIEMFNIIELDDPSWRN